MNMVFNDILFSVERLWPLRAALSARGVEARFDPSDLPPSFPYGYFFDGEVDISDLPLADPGAVLHPAGLVLEVLPEVPLADVVLQQALDLHGAPGELGAEARDILARTDEARRAITRRRSGSGSRPPESDDDGDS